MNKENNLGFNIEVILSILHGRPYSTKEEIRNFLSFITGENLPYLGLGVARDFAFSVLIDRFPQLISVSFPEKTEKIENWIENVSVTYGRFFEIEPTVGWNLYKSTRFNSLEEDLINEMFLTQNLWMS